MSESRTYSSEVRAILRCRGCKTAHLAEFTTSTTLWAYEGRPATRRSVTWGGHEQHYGDRYDLAAIVARDFTCSKCSGHGVSFDVIRGSFSESVKCGGRCRSAVRASCDCQCSGENHGSAHTRISA